MCRPNPKTITLIRRINFICKKISYNYYNKFYNTVDLVNFASIWFSRFNRQHFVISENMSLGMFVIHFKFVK